MIDSERFKSYINTTLNSYKCKQMEDNVILLPVYCNDVKVAYLRPITADFEVTIPNCAEIMSKWRIENPTIGTGTFQITTERTCKWIYNGIINNEDRIIFLIVDFHGKCLGHIGLASFDYELMEAEIDSVLRGDKSAIPGIMNFAMNSIISWARNTLKLKSIILKVFSDNEHAINFYKKYGFEVVESYPLVKVFLPGEVKWEISEDLNLKNAEKYYLKMKYLHY